MFLQKNDEILKNAPDGAVAYSLYDYGDSTHGLYLNCENQFFDDEENVWVDMVLVDDYFHSIRRIQDIKTIVEYEHWIAAIADDHKQIPDWIQQSARSLLANSAT
jgi:hypothetical protein